MSAPMHDVPPQISVRVVDIRLRSTPCIGSAPVTTVQARLAQLPGDTQHTLRLLVIRGAEARVRACVRSPFGELGRRGLDSAGAAVQAHPDAGEWDAELVGNVECAIIEVMCGWARAISADGRDSTARH